MWSKSREKASSTSSSSSADDTKHATKLGIFCNGTDDHEDDDDDGDDDLLYADLAALSIQPTLSSSCTNTTTTTSSSSITSPLSWQLWRFDCRDLPVHRSKNKWHPPICDFCAVLNKLRKLCPNAKDESPERWPTYLKRGRAFDDAQSVLEYVKMDTDNVLPSKLARDVSFNRKLGTAFFRAGIAPMEEHPENRDGGKHLLLLLATTGATNRRLVKGFDTIFVHIVVRLIAELPDSILKCINGVFCRCEIHPMNRLGRNFHRDHKDMPLMCKLEVWIGDAKQEQLVHRELISKIEAGLQNLGVYKKLSFRCFTKSDE